MNILKETAKKHGVVSVEMIWVIFFVVMTLLVCLGFFSYLYPRQVLEKEVHLLAQQAKITGGLTAGQVDAFIETMNDYGYTAEVYAYSAANMGEGHTGSVLNVVPRDSAYELCMSGSYNPFVRRDSGERIVIDVVVNADDGLIKGPLRWFTAKTLSENYTLTEVVLSERNKC